MNEKLPVSIERTFYNVPKLSHALSEPRPLS